MYKKLGLSHVTKTEKMDMERHNRQEYYFTRQNLIGKRNSKKKLMREKDVCRACLAEVRAAE